MWTLLQTKSFWVGLGAICTAVGLAVSGEISWTEAIPQIIFGIAIITGRHAIAKLK